MITGNRQAALARGHRLRSARMLTGLSRKELGEKIGVSADTLTSWESPREHNAGLSDKGAKRIIVSLKKLGIDCSYDWLYNGIGTGLSTSNYPELAGTSKLEAPAVDWGDSLNIIREIEFFKQLNANSTVVVVMDDGLAPRYSLGDYVGGHWYSPEKLSESAGHFCIIETEEGLTFTRLVSSVGENSACTFSCTNPFTTVSLPVQYNVKVDRIAKIVWHRKVG